MTRIVVLDGYTTSPRLTDASTASMPTHVSWNPLVNLAKSLGTYDIQDRTPHDKVTQAIGEAPYVLTNKTPIDAETMAACPKLKYIGVLATGVNVVDLDAAKANGITVTNVPGYSTPSVAQHVFALLLSIVSRVHHHDEAVHDNQWTTCPDFSFTLGPLTELADLKLGIVGMGAIGQAVARIGHAMGMEVIAHSRTERELDFPVQWLGVDDLFKEADVVSLHCPLTPQTQGMVNATRLRRMKRTAVLINTGRGPLIDESALAQALRDGLIMGAGLDVLSSEPPSADNPLLTAPRCVITPHVAWATVASRRQLLRTAVDNLRGFLDGKPVNVVS